MAQEATCAWVICAGVEVWSGEGNAPGPPTNMYSGLAEAYGICTVPRFLLQYTYHYPTCEDPDRLLPLQLAKKGQDGWACPGDVGEAS